MGYLNDTSHDIIYSKVQLIMSNKQQLLFEVFGSAHWKQRKQERVDKASLSMPSNFWDKDDDKTQVLQILQKAIFAKVEDNIKFFISSVADKDPAKHYITVLANIKVKRNGKIFDPIIRAKSSGKYGGLKDNEGNVYVTVSQNNTAFTLLLLPNNKSDANTLTNAHINNHKRERGEDLSIHDVVYRKLPKFVIVIDFDYEMHLANASRSTKKLSIKDLPYTVRTDYRTGADFVHKQYGKGKIVATSSGSKGKGDARGHLDWIDVDFGKPFVKGGKLTTIRRIDNIYTNIHFKESIMHKNKTVSAQQLAESIYKQLNEENEVLKVMDGAKAIMFKAKKALEPIIKKAEMKNYLLPGHNSLKVRPHKEGFELYFDIRVRPDIIKVVANNRFTRDSRELAYFLKTVIFIAVTAGGNFEHGRGYIQSRTLPFQSVADSGKSDQAKVKNLAEIKQFLKVYADTLAKQISSMNKFAEKAETLSKEAY